MLHIPYSKNKTFILLLLIVCLYAACSQRLVVDSSAENTFNSQAILIHESGLGVGPCEPSICIDPTNKNRILAASVLNNVYISNDGGNTWDKSKLNSSHGVYGDPVLVANYNGDFFYAHLSNPSGRAYASEDFLDRIVIQRSDDGGKSWTDGSFTLPRSPKDQDKQWLAVDPKDNSLYITWTEFDLYSSTDPADKSRILFSRSIDNGDSWSYPIVLSQHEGNCLDDDQTTEGAVPCVGNKGEIFVAWSHNEKIYFDRSLDRGVTWLDEDIVVADQPGGWTYDIPGISRCNGMPITCTDRSTGKFNGRIYVNWSDQKNGTEDTDIWISSSDDKGDTWTNPVKVNSDASNNHQFLTWMDVDQSTGYVYTVFYDRRNHDDNTTDVFLAISKDGGRTFTDHKINKESFTPNTKVFFGDYNDISVVDGSVRPIWTQQKNTSLSVWTALIDP